MARYFIVTLTAQMVTQYKVVYSITSNTSNFDSIALVSPYGATDLAENLTYFDLTDGLGLTVKVPDNVHRIRIVDQNNYCGDCESPTFTPIPAQYNYYAVTGCPGSNNAGRDMYIRTYQTMENSNSIIYGVDSYSRYSTITEQSWLAGSGDLPSITSTSNVSPACPSITRTEFFVTSNTSTTSDQACNSGIGTGKLYHDGAGALPAVGDTVYYAATGATAVSWSNYRGMNTQSNSSSTQSITTFPSGEVSSVTICSASTRTPFFVSSQALYTSPALACSSTPIGYVQKWHNGNSTLPVLGNTIFNFSSGTSVFVTGQSWVKISQFDSIPPYGNISTTSEGIVDDANGCP
jgi:hypothetical protein